MAIRIQDLPQHLQSKARDLFADRTDAEDRVRSAEHGASELEKLFDLQIQARGLPEPEREYRFHPHRKWRFDFAWPEQRVAVEIQGGTWTGGRHVRGRGAATDMEKINAAQSMGWRVYLFDAEKVRSGKAGEQTERFLEVGL